MSECFSVSAKIKHSKLKETPKADLRAHVEPTNRWYGCSESLCQVMSIG